MILDTVTQEESVFSLNPEHEIVKKYLELKSWEKIGLPSHIGKRAILNVLEYHLNHCIFERDLAHETIKKYFQLGNWTKIGIHSQQGKRAIIKVLRFHMIYCLHVMQEPSKITNQKVVAKCRICGKEMEPVSPSAKRKYCSKECLRMADRHKPMSDKRRVRCSKEWQRIRKERMSNFGSICPISLEKESIEVHHIDSDWMNNEPENLIPLWTPLHRLITARANYDEFYEAKDRAVLLSIINAWKE